MAEYNPSKIIKDGNTYNFRDNTKIPLAGSNQISGSLIPATTDAYDLGSSSYAFKNIYGLNYKLKEGNVSSIDASHAVAIYGGTDYSDGGFAIFYGKNSSSNGGYFLISANDGTNSCILQGAPNGTLTWGSKNVAMQEDTVPRSGGAVMTSEDIGRTNNTAALTICGGTNHNDGGTVTMIGSSFPAMDLPGAVRFEPALSETNRKTMYLFPNGTWTWNGTACQITSDQRYKQQISNIDDKLLDAWEDVNLVQFKYNDAVDQKKDKARLHTGYVVQQIDSACKSHNVDISEYGLYCHEEYPQETEEVEVEQADGTKVKERKVIREASEHYSLRYTECLVVECAYLRKKLKELTARIEQLESSK